jgi:acetoacetate decarboxylase
MHGDLWLSAFRLRGSSARPAGWYAAAFVVYREPSPLTYSELLVARLADDRPSSGLAGLVNRLPTGPVTVTDIWVDSPDSLAGGRELWAIPKDLGDFGMESTRTGPVRRTAWRASLGDRRIATARFTDVSALAPPVPFRGTVRQTRDSGAAVLAPVRGRARTLPARAHWDFAPDGPLGFLAGHRTLASFRLADFRITFG